ncbi:hypothetical protein, partial [uncultured Paracoccus sp.]|uniref:hypothetical protein n=1 Tax=uncultured Paracoccus sp. TaxID=189685 RepID=UPI0025E73CBE
MDGPGHGNHPGQPPWTLLPLELQQYRPPRIPVCPKGDATRAVNRRAGAGVALAGVTAWRRKRKRSAVP